ncbi:glycoside hydrolase family 2 protein [Deinococcus peraridilitoris]|uniref:Beta-mannosidase n=1 Tax=Deinococcus peraridilitoris (strain DSM 19664 / LMG 22246 / CIP 109416 / KR-200) TaxID=937777 RepID=K9ZVV6_DEIPD|nr:glycoside hydrolase family 2 TIM barrel-domain containing protein [Deinococcus peraridilitoris]AFZ65671.1 beta-galactosidase/beta-glucuronidase [Deinococcus peraridilitoris DSM 19664]
MKITLSGSDWQFKHYLGDDWVWRHAEKPTSRDVLHWHPANVPGSVHHDLLRAGLISDPYSDQQSLQAEWAAQRTWIYKKTFPAPELTPGERLTLHFEGIDYAAEIYLNGELLGRHQSMFTPAEFDVTRRVTPGQDSLLAVVLHRAPDEESQVGRSERVRTHKSRMTYGWDFCPRLIHLGLWDDVYLERTGSVRVTDLHARARLSSDFTQADLQVTGTFDASVPADVQLDLTIRGNDGVIAKERISCALAAGESAQTFCVRIERPHLWWPNGHGEQPLYEAILDVVCSDGLSCQRQVEFGIRQIDARRNEGAGEDALPYTLVVNGRREYLNGWNWVPLDVMYGVERSAKLERLIQLAVQANVNLLRVWGGGLIEKEAFYRLCDRHGLMVWQEFNQSSSGISNTPPDDGAFTQMMTREAEGIIPQRRNHPSLVIWCGGNELMHEGNVPLTGDEGVLRALRSVVKRLDPDRHWLPTSPSGPAASNSLSVIGNNPAGQHDVHGPWEHQGLQAQYTLYNSATSMLHSEFGAEGLSNLPLLRGTISQEHRWPAGRDNPMYAHRGAWWINEPLVQELFGGVHDLDTLSRASQLLQHEALRYALEANRRRQWHNSGSIPWQFNESFPNAWSTSAVDYDAETKSGYWAVRKAYDALAVTARFAAQMLSQRTHFEAEVFVAHQHARPLGEFSVQVSVIGASGKVALSRTRAIMLPGNDAVRVDEVCLSRAAITDEVFFLDLKILDAATAIVAENRYLFVKGETLRPVLHSLCTTLRVDVPRPGVLQITNGGSFVALDVRLEPQRERGAPGWAYFSSNHFHLLPGERREVHVSWSPEAEDRRVRIQAINSEVTLCE